MKSTFKVLFYLKRSSIRPNCNSLYLCVNKIPVLCEQNTGTLQTKYRYFVDKIPVLCKYMKNSSLSSVYILGRRNEDDIEFRVGHVRV
ncbi:hypothetical protein M2133_001130 [Parabacteroides sp. PF5-6]|nr:hypothetical protein [Parabacteroides sp. PF5-6]